MKRIFRLSTYCILALSITLAACSAEDGQDGIAGRDGIDGVNGDNGAPGTPGQNGVGAIDLGWSAVPSAPLEEEEALIILTVDFEGSITAAQLETFGIFSYVRFPSNADLKFALPTNVLFVDDMNNSIAYDISFLGIDNTALLFAIQREDGAPIPAGTVIPDLEFKTILVPSTPAGKRAIDSGQFLD